MRSRHAEAMQLIKNEAFLDAYETCSDIIYFPQEITAHQYHRLARQLWAARRYSDAERVLEAAMHGYPDNGAIRDTYDMLRADRATIFQFRQTPLSERRFHIDSLRNLTVKKDQLDAIEIRGWVQLSEQGSELLVQEDDDPIRVKKLSIPRKDVVGHLRSAKISGQLLLCGFSFKAKLTGKIRISLRSPSGITPIVEVVSHRILQVLEGRDGWLFLNNDTNRSADLFTGKLPVTARDCAAWTRFARTAASSLKTQVSSLKYCLVIAPSKEDVFPDFHPLKAASVSIVDAIYSSIFTTGIPVSCPIRRLRQEADSYYPTDTHWSDLGAYVCVRDILETLKIDLPDDFKLQFQDMEVSGDLGSKLTPARRSRRKVLAQQERSAKLTFDNRVLGSSGIQIYENDRPVIDDTVLIFGGSSSDQLSRVMAEIFRKIVRVNSPLTMPIIEVVDTVAPGIVLMQTNARYLKSCPKLAKTIADSTLSKLDHTGFPQGWLQGKHSG